LAVEKIEIPRKTVYRLSLYLRCLDELSNNHVETVSSNTLAKAAGVKPPQLRKDLGHVGHFGTRGLGYGVEALSQAISEVLGSARLHPVVIIGVGNLGSALMSYGGFKKEGFEIIGAFDLYPELVEERSSKSKIPIQHVDNLHQFILDNDVKMAILCVPSEAGQRVANVLVAAGIQAILNFSPVVLQVPDEVTINHMDLALELESLSYFVKNINHDLP